MGWCVVHVQIVQFPHQNIVSIPFIINMKLPITMSFFGINIGFKVGLKMLGSWANPELKLGQLEILGQNFFSRNQKERGTTELILGLFLKLNYNSRDAFRINLRALTDKCSVRRHRLPWQDTDGLLMGNILWEILFNMQL